MFDKASPPVGIASLEHTYFYRRDRQNGITALGRLTCVGTVPSILGLWGPTRNQLRLTTTLLSRNLPHDHEY